ncbi:MAG: TonB-dependent receptor [Proteobacteria bacterium]|nr:TonB-dependent receptor [Pseudomonadota bacterium]
MNRNLTVSAAVLAILSAHAASAADAPDRTDAAQPPLLQEVIVTAQHREESIQNVPITMQALTAETLTHLNVSTFDDYVKYVPNVTFAGNGPGQSNIYMRGLATPSSGVEGSGAVGSFPNVAVYLDEMSGQVPNRNLDIYAADLERIEILEGPQGTLFGAGAQAGVIRYITNKPKLNVIEANFNAGYSVTAGGDPSSDLDATINLPLITDKLAVRAVIYNEARGGYINNIPGTFERLPTDKAIIAYFGGVVPQNSGPINNYQVAGRAFNPVTYKGIRGEALYQINDDWNALLTQSYQNMEADGVFFQEGYDGAGKTLPEMSVQLFNPSYNRDKWENTQLTVTGKIQQLKLLYAGGYLNRNVSQQQDLTNYSRGVYADYYQCNYPGYPFNTVGGKITPTPGSAGYCFSPSGFWQDHERSTHQSHELRLSTPDDRRVRALGGLFWENFTIHEQTDWFYGSSPNFHPVGPPSVDPATGGSFPVTANNPNVRPLNDAFFDDITRGYKQKAAFLSVDVDLIPKVLTLTGGTRYYDIEDFEKGSNVGSFGCEINGPYNGNVPPNPCVSTPATGVLSNLNNLDAKHLNKTYKGWKSRGNLTWHVLPDALLYYTWSQGFRPGGFNRAQSIIKPGSPIYGLFVPPLAYDPDTLTNNEIGWKTEWLDHRVQFNGAVYQEDWKGTQIAIFDPGVTGNLIFTTNGPDYRVRGVETSFVVRPLPGLTLTANGAWNSSEVVKTLNLRNPAGEPINIVNPFGELGSPLAQSPPFAGSIRARYEVPFGDYMAFGQVGANHQGGSYASTDKLTKTLQGNSVAFYDPGFTTYDASAGISKDDWAVQVYAQNLTNVHANLYSSYNDFIKAETVNRPRVVGVHISYHFKQNH